MILNDKEDMFSFGVDKMKNNGTMKYYKDKYSFWGGYKYSSLIPYQDKYVLNQQDSIGVCCLFLRAKIGKC